MQDPSVLDLVETEEQEGEDGEQQYGDSDHWRIPSADDSPRVPRADLATRGGCEGPVSTSAELARLEAAIAVGGRDAAEPAVFLVRVQLVKAV